MTSRLLYPILVLPLLVLGLSSCGDKKTGAVKEEEIVMTSAGFVKAKEPNKQQSQGASAVSETPQSIQLPGLGQQAYVEGLRVPVEYWPDGKIKTQLNADEAKVNQTNGFILAKGLRFDMLDPNEKPQTTVITPDCVFDRTGGKAYSESVITFQQTGFRVTGKGYNWDMKNQKLILDSDVKVVINRRVASSEKGLLR